MSRQQRLIYLPLLGTTLLGLLVWVYLVAWKRFSKSTPPKITKHTVETPSEDVLAYWTTDKMRQAEAMPLPKTNALKREKRPLQRPSDKA